MFRFAEVMHASIEPVPALTGMGVMYLSEICDLMKGSVYLRANGNKG